MGLLALQAIVAIALTIEAALGFGATLITVTFGSFFLPIQSILPAFIPLNLVLSTYLAVRYRKDIDWSFLGRRLLPFMVLGMPLGILAFARLPAEWLTRGLGLFVLVLCAFELSGASPTSEPLGRGRERLLAFIGGAIHGAFATGGPMVVYLSNRAIHDKGAFRATLSALWLILDVVLIFGYFTGGRVDEETWQRALALVPSLVVGMLFGELLFARVSKHVFRRIVYGTLMFGAFALLVR